MISKVCMKLKQGYIFHKNANCIPSSSLLYKEEWFGRSLEERRPNNSFVALPWKYKYKQNTSCFHRLQSFTAQKHHRARDIADPGNSRIQLLPTFWNFPWNVDHLCEIQHALTAMQCCHYFEFFCDSTLLCFSWEWKQEYWNATRKAMCCFPLFDEK